MIENKLNLNTTEYKQHIYNLLKSQIKQYYENNKSFSLKDTFLTYKIKSNKANKEAQNIINNIYEDIIDYYIPNYDKKTQLISKKEARQIIETMTELFEQTIKELEYKKEEIDRFQTLEIFLKNAFQNYTYRIEQRAILKGE